MEFSGTFGKVIQLTGRNIYDVPDARVYLNYPTEANEALSFSGVGEAGIYFTLPRLSKRDNSVIYYNTINYSIITGLKYIDIPFVSGFSPSSGQWGDLIRVSGREFIEVTGVFVGDKLSENFYTSGENNLFFTIPYGSDSNSIEIRATGGVVNTFPNALFNIGSFTGDLKVIIPDLSIDGFTKNYVKYNEKVFVSGKGLHIVNQLSFSGVGGIGGFISLEELVHLGSTGITFRVPTGVLNETRFRLNNAGFNSVQTIENLFITGYSIINVINTHGRYQDIIPISGTNMSGRPFYFRGYTISGEFPNLIESLSYNYISNELIELTVPKEVIRGPIYISGEDGLISSEDDFTPIPTIFQLQSEYLTVGTKFTLKARNATEIYKLLGISGYNRYENKTGIYFILNDQTQEPSEDPNVSDDYFGDFHVNYGALLNNYPSGLTTGHVLISGIINNSFVGTGFLFLASTNNTLGELDLSVLDEALSFKDNFKDIYNSPNFGEILFSEGVIVSSKTPVISGFTERVPRTGELEITGKYLMSSTGFSLGSGPGARFISSEDFVLDLADNVVTKVKTSALQSNVYEYEQRIRIRTEDFGFTGKSGTLDVMYISPS